MMTTNAKHSPQETRRRIITSMKPGREYTASDLARFAHAATQRAISRSMGEMEKMGLVVSDRIFLSDGPVTAWRLNVMAEGMTHDPHPSNRPTLLPASLLATPAQHPPVATTPPARYAAGKPTEETPECPF